VNPFFGGSAHRLWPFRLTSSAHPNVLCLGAIPSLLKSKIAYLTRARTNRAQRHKSGCRLQEMGPAARYPPDNPRAEGTGESTPRHLIEEPRRFEPQISFRPVTRFQPDSLAFAVLQSHFSYAGS